MLIPMLITVPSVVVCATLLGAVIRATIARIKASMSAHLTD